MWGAGGSEVVEAGPVGCDRDPRHPLVHLAHLRLKRVTLSVVECLRGPWLWSRRSRVRVPSLTFTKPLHKRHFRPVNALVTARAAWLAVRLGRQGRQARRASPPAVLGSGAVGRVPSSA